MQLVQVTSKAELVALLQRLGKAEVDYRTLEHTGVGKAVNTVSRSVSLGRGARELAKQLVQQWKELARSTWKIASSNDDSCSSESPISSGMLANNKYALVEVPRKQGPL